MSHIEHILITVNGESQSIPSGASLATVIANAQLAAEAVATAVNGEFVPRNDRVSRELLTGDAVFTFQAITGG
jgi:sulfur carrier protein